MQPQTFLRSACAGVEAGSACLQGLAQKKKFIGYSGAVIVFVFYIPTLTLLMAVS